MNPRPPYKFASDLLCSNLSIIIDFIADLIFSSELPLSPFINSLSLPISASDAVGSNCLASSTIDLYISLTVSDIASSPKILSAMLDLATNISWLYISLSLSFANMLARSACFSNSVSAPIALNRLPNLSFCIATAATDAKFFTYCASLCICLSASLSD